MSSETFKFDVVIKIVNEESNVVAFSSYQIVATPAPVVDADRELMKLVAHRARLDIERYLANRKLSNTVTL